MLNHKSTRSARLFWLGALLGAAVFLLVYGLAPLDVANDAFCRGGYIEKDIQQHYAGWLFYRSSALGWPLGVTQAVNAPQGVSVAYTDSIPLLAVLCRPLAAALGGTFQYFGWFTLVCFALQGGFAALLCGLFAEGLAAPLAGSLVFAASPILLERAFRHTSLGAQWLVLAALYCYFVCRRQSRFASRGLFVINILAVGIHPYFLPMTYAVTLALLLEYAVKQRQWLRPALFLGGNMLCTAALGWALGLLYGTATSGGQALYGYFAMNLNALWNPAGVNGVLYSRLLPAQNQVGGNYDAFAYLGLGVLAALPVVVVSARRHILPAVRHHWALCAVCAVLTAFAVSNVITANGVTLATLPLPASFIKLFSVFRSGGRLFWPVYYLLTLAAFAGLARLPAGRLGHSVCRRAAVGCKPGALPAARRHAGRAGHGRVPVRAGQRFLAERGTVPPHRIRAGHAGRQLTLSAVGRRQRHDDERSVRRPLRRDCSCRRAPDRTGRSRRGHAAE